MKLVVLSVLAACRLAYAAGSAVTIPNPSTCEKLVDDMGTNRPSPSTKLDHYNNTKTLNLLGGDYGVDSSSQIAFSFASSGGHVDVTPGTLPLSTGPDADAALHPANIQATNYFYFKFVWDDQISSTQFGVNVCEDLTPYQGLYLNVSMPAGSNVYLTLTQKNAECSARTQDSAYVKLADFHTPDGTPQAFFIPFSLMKYEFDNTTLYNFQHAKDATFVNFSPAGAVYSFYHIGLVNQGGSCTPGSGSGTSAAASLAPPTTGTAGSNAAAATGTGGLSPSGGPAVSAPAPTGSKTGGGGVVGVVGLGLWLFVGGVWLLVAVA